MDLSSQAEPQAAAEKLDLGLLEHQFLAEMKAKGRSSNTLKNYRTDLECFNQYLLEQQKDLNITGFGMPQILQYGEFLERKYSAHNSRRRRVQALRIFFDFLVASGKFGSNPVRKIPTSPKILDIPRPPSFLHLKTLWNYLLEEAHTQKPMGRLLAKRNQLVVLFIFHGGLKVSDLAQMKVKDFIPGAEPRVLVAPPKRDPYSIPLPAYVGEIFEQYLVLMQSHQTQAFPELFFNANQYKILSAGLSPRGLEIIFEEWRKKLLIEITPKSLRQACIINWLHTKHPDSLIKEWMGVAPDYSLKLYRDQLLNHRFSAVALEELFREQQNKATLLH